MLDTVILQLKPNEYHIEKYENFNTTKELVLNARGGFKKWVNNPTAKDKKNDIYKPRLTLIKRGLIIFLKIEFSAPKLIYGNNVDELEDGNFDLIVKTLRERMKSMGVIVFSKHIEGAEVITFHPSKNIVLKDGYTAHFAIKELNKIDCSKRFDFDEKNYRNNGQVLQFYTRSHSLVIYDKMADLTKPQKRATDKDQTKQQLSLFDFIKEKNNKLELLRIEIRLSLKGKMNEILKEVGYAPSPQFKDIFKKDLCKKIVNLYWTNFFSDNQFLFDSNSSSQAIFQKILMRYPKTKILQAIKMTGLYMLCKDDEGIRGFRQIIDNYKTKTNWQVVKRDLKLFKDDIFINSSWGFIKDVKQGLIDFKAFRVEN
jgi:hypothetical protein